MKKPDWSDIDRIPWIGTATSSFQADPLDSEADSDRRPVLDWEYELRKSIAHKPSALNSRQFRGNMPRLMAKVERYAARSAELGMNMFRISFEPGRLCPRIGEFDDGAMARYIRLLAFLVLNGQEPMVTLQHFTMPLSLCGTGLDGIIEQGAWENPRILEYFRYYVETILTYLGNRDFVRQAVSSLGLDARTVDGLASKPLVSHFVTLNEPAMTVTHGYVLGAYPPFKKACLLGASAVMKKLVAVHDIAYEAIHTALDAKSGAFKPKVGVAYNWPYFDGPIGKLTHSVLNEILYADRFERDGSHSDFVGLQYYFRMTPLSFGKSASGRIYGDHPGFGDIYAAGFSEVMKRMHEAYPSKDVFVTEFGFPDEDWKRPYWILENVDHALQALREGVPLKSLLLWSLVDNLEWDWGMSQRFGLFRENELGLPLDSLRYPERLRGWEVWQAVAEAARKPSAEAIARLDAMYERAKTQFDHVVTNEDAKESIQ